MILVVLYLVAIVAANLSVAYFGPAASIVNAFLFIGLDLTIRDLLHEHWQSRNLIRNMALLIVSGSFLSYALNANAGMIALASFFAFAAASTGDTIVYAILGNRAKMLRVNGSNVVSAAIDSVIFPAIAFGFPMLWGIMAGQFMAKVVGGFVWSLVLRQFWYESKVVRYL